MRAIGGLFVFVGGIALHWWWSTYLTAWGFAPHLLLVMTVIVASTRGPIAGQCFGFGWGLFLDVVGARLFGANALLFTVSAYLVGGARRQMDVSSPLSQAMMVAAVSVGHVAGLSLLGLVFERQAFWGGWALALGAPLVNAVAAPFLYPLLDRALGDS